MRRRLAALMAVTLGVGCSDQPFNDEPIVGPERSPMSVRISEIAHAPSSGMVVSGPSIETTPFDGLFANGDLRAAGMVESQAGGFKFPDASVQTSAVSGAWGDLTGVPAGFADDVDDIGAPVSHSHAGGDIVDESLTAADLAPNSVTSSEIADNSVGSTELLNQAVTSPKIAINAVENAHIQNHAVTTDKIQDDAVVQNKIQDNAVSAVKIQDNAVTTNKILNAAVTSAKLAEQYALVDHDHTASSHRYKDDVDDLELGLDAILRLRPVTFRWRTEDGTTGTTDLGFLAEDVAALAPLLATYDVHGAPDGVRYRQMTALLTRGIQELVRIIERQGHDMRRLENAVAAMQK